MEKITFEELLEEFDPSVHDAIERLSEKARHIAVMENVQLDSSAVGEKSALGLGVGFTYETPEAVEGKHLGDLPSQRKYPVRYAECPWYHKVMKLDPGSYDTESILFDVNFNNYSGDPEEYTWLNKILDSIANGQYVQARELYRPGYVTLRELVDALESRGDTAGRNWVLDHLV